MICKSCFALELLDRVVLHWNSCIEQDICALCCLYNLMILEYAVPFNHKGEWVTEAKQRWAERIDDQMQEQLDLLPLEEPF